ncbi:MAG TPA: iron-sulfur cluster assembly protein [Solirubrobacteraceae bacterium]|nr:iron-sulfur cluster assembly protein [Solirubrobacteraceae bacterium]
MIAREALLEELRGVPEPCSLLVRAPTNIVDMGLVDEIACENGHVRVELVLTDPSCVHFTGTRRYITDLVLEVDGVESVEVTMSTTTLWTPDRRR